MTDLVLIETMEEEIDVTTTDNERPEAEDADVDVECDDPESTHSSAQPLHYGCYPGPTNRDRQKNIKDFKKEDVVETATVGTNGNETDKINNSECCTVCDFKRDDGKHENLRFVVGNKYVLTNNKERDWEADSTRELRYLRVEGEGTSSPLPAEQPSLPEQTPLESRKDRLTFRGGSIPISPSDQHSQPGEQPPYRGLPGPQPVLRLSNFSISHILKPNFLKNRRKNEECGAFSKHVSESKANEYDLPVDYSDIRWVIIRVFHNSRLIR